MQYLSFHQRKKIISSAQNSTNTSPPKKAKLDDWDVLKRMQNHVILDVGENRIKISRATLKKAGGVSENLDSVPSLP